MFRTLLNDCTPLIIPVINAVFAVEDGIPAIKSQLYTLQEIFDKNLLLLLPFYIFSHEKRFGEYEKDTTKLKLLQAEYGQIKNRLEDLAENGAISEYVKCKMHNYRHVGQSTGTYRSKARCCAGRSEGRYGRKGSGI